MHFSTLAAVAAIAPFVSAHGGMGLPKIAGINMRDLKSRDLLATLEARIAEVQVAHAHASGLVARQDDRECGAGIGSCAAGQCCSGAGCMLPHVGPLYLRDTDKRQIAELTPTTATPPVVTTSTVLAALRTSPLLEPTPRQSLAPRSAPFSTVVLVFTTVSPLAQLL